MTFLVMQRNAFCRWHRVVNLKLLPTLKFLNYRKLEDLIGDKRLHKSQYAQF